jgi:altronate dehydratase small subunit
MKGRVVEEALLVMDERDTVATVMEDLETGRAFDLDVPFATAVDSDPEERVEVLESIPFGHKVALVPIGAGDPVYKYGEVIGSATRAIEPGEHVHTHNVESNRARGDLRGEA